MVFVLIGVSAHPVWLGLIFSYLLGYRAAPVPDRRVLRLRLRREQPEPVRRAEATGRTTWFCPGSRSRFLFAALYARMIRASLLETMDEDYVRTARAKGASEWRVLRKHVLRNALMPVIAMLSMDMVVISVTGVIFIETVFQLPGHRDDPLPGADDERPAGDPRRRRSWSASRSRSRT